MSRQITHEEMQQAFDLAYILHPRPDVALRVTIDACDFLTVLEGNQARRSRSTKHWKTAIPSEMLLQIAVFVVSDRRERDQESPRPRLEPKYKPTRDDLVVRYLKHLMLKTALLNWRYAAIGIGCLLYSYKPSDIADLLLFESEENNLRKIKMRIARDLCGRFAHSGVVPEGTRSVRTRPANDHDRLLVQRTLEAFTPWQSSHITPATPDGLLLERLFDKTKPISDWNLKHALMDTQCAGFERLVYEYNDFFSSTSMGRRLADPLESLVVPDFQGTPTPPLQRFNRPLLTDSEKLLLTERRRPSGPWAYDLDDLYLYLRELDLADDPVQTNPATTTFPTGALRDGRLLCFMDKPDSRGVELGSARELVGGQVLEAEREKPAGRRAKKEQSKCLPTMEGESGPEAVIGGRNVMVIGLGGTSASIATALRALWMPTINQLVREEDEEAGEDEHPARATFPLAKADFYSADMKREIAVYEFGSPDRDANQGCVARLPREDGEHWIAVLRDPSARAGADAIVLMNKFAQELASDMMRRYKCAVRLAARRINHPDAEGLAHEVFCTVWKNLPQFESIANARGWMLTAISNELRDHDRLHAKWRVVPSLLESTEEVFERVFQTEIGQVESIELSEDARELRINSRAVRRRRSAVARRTKGNLEMITFHLHEHLKNGVSVATRDTVQSKIRSAITRKLYEIVDPAEPASTARGRAHKGGRNEAPMPDRHEGLRSAELSMNGHYPEKHGILACLLAAEAVATRGASITDQLSWVLDGAQPECDETREQKADRPRKLTPAVCHVRPRIQVTDWYDSLSARLILDAVIISPPECDETREPGGCRAEPWTKPSPSYKIVCLRSDLTAMIEGSSWATQ
jgi:DNA-directed RNA polymerase specialized sigma24 family protein